MKINYGPGMQALGQGLTNVASTMANVGAQQQSVRMYAQETKFKADSLLAQLKVEEFVQGWNIQHDKDLYSDGYDIEGAGDKLTEDVYGLYESTLKGSFSDDSQASRFEASVLAPLTAKIRISLQESGYKVELGKASQKAEQAEESIFRGIVSGMDPIAAWDGLMEAADVISGSKALSSTQRSAMVVGLSQKFNLAVANHQLSRMVNSGMDPSEALSVIDALRSGEMEGDAGEAASRIYGSLQKPAEGLSVFTDAEIEGLKDNVKSLWGVRRDEEINEVAMASERLQSDFTRELETNPDSLTLAWYNQKLSESPVLQRNQYGSAYQSLNTIKNDIKVLEDGRTTNGMLSSLASALNQYPTAEEAVAAWNTESFKAQFHSEEAYEKAVKVGQDLLSEDPFGGYLRTATNALLPKEQRVKAINDALRLGAIEYEQYTKLNNIINITNTSPQVDEAVKSVDLFALSLVGNGKKEVKDLSSKETSQYNEYRFRLLDAFASRLSLEKDELSTERVQEILRSITSEDKDFQRMVKYNIGDPATWFSGDMVKMTRFIQDGQVVETQAIMGQAYAMYTTALTETFANEYGGIPVSMSPSDRGPVFHAMASDIPELANLPGAEGVAVNIMYRVDDKGKTYKVYGVQSDGVLEFFDIRNVQASSTPTPAPVDNGYSERTATEHASQSYMQKRVLADMNIWKKARIEAEVRQFIQKNDQTVPTAQDLNGNYSDEEVSAVVSSVQPVIQAAPDPQPKPVVQASAVDAHQVAKNFGMVDTTDALAGLHGSPAVSKTPYTWEAANKQLASKALYRRTLVNMVEAWMKSNPGKVPTSKDIVHVLFDTADIQAAYSILTLGGR